jgi:ribosome maturation factor RimP
MSSKVGTLAHFFIGSTKVAIITMGLTILEKVRELAEPVIKELNLDLVDIEYLQQKGRGIVRITIDKDNGVTLEDCTKVNREVGYILEIKDVFPHPYNLEVSSPGLERPLKTLGDFEKFLGRKVSLKTSELLNGKRNFKGTLAQVQKGMVVLEMDGGQWEIPFNLVRHAKLVYEFPQKSF